MSLTMPLTEMDADTLRLHVDTLRRQMQDIEAQWTQAILQMPTADSLLLADGRVTTAEESMFFYGQQWPGELEAVRVRDLRPVCVVNRLPTLVAAALDADRRNNYPQLGSRDIGRLRGIIVRQYRDLQQLYNYVVSSHVEALKVVGA